MTQEDIIKWVASAIIGFVVPAALKVFWPKEPDSVESLPWFAWCVAGFVGGALGGLASGILGITGTGLGGFGNWAIFGMAIGLFQWFALRGYRSVGIWFILASLIGWTLFMLGGAWGWVVSGLAVGILQSLSLTSYRRPFLWIIANPIVWPIAGWAGIAAGTPLVSLNPVLAWIVGWGVVGFVGAILLLLPLGLIKEKD